MTHRNFRLVATALIFSFTSSLALGQGTATAPSTVHLIDGDTNIVWIGGPNDSVNGPAPIPIDLDVNGLPWRKGLVSDADGFDGGSILIRETIFNSGTEPWTDWHEIDAGIGSHGTTWGDVSEVRINGTSITFNATVTPTTIDLDTFSMPVLPGDVLQIEKRLQVLTDNVVGPGVLVASLLEYPTTTVPEPGSVLLTAGAFGLLLAGISRRRSIRRKGAT